MVQVLRGLATCPRRVLAAASVAK